MTVLCFAETDRDGVIDASARALAFARSLAPAGESLAVAVFPGTGAPGTGAPGVTAPVLADLAAHGVADVHAVEIDDGGYAPMAWARALAGLSTELPATAVIAAGTDRGSEVMAYLGALTGVDTVANCVSAVRTGGAALQVVRERWAGLLLEDAVLEAVPALLTVAPDSQAPGSQAPASGAAESSAAGQGAAGQGAAGNSSAERGQPVVHRCRPTLHEGDMVVRATESDQRGGGISLASARVVVGGGRGVGGPEGFGALEELAGLLGAAVGVSRVVTSQGWRPHKQQVGQTGTRITPELYLACGISGAIQHMAGCLGARHIVAINTDPAAPIMSHADYAVIGDLSQVIPAITAAIRERTG